MSAIAKVIATLITYPLQIAQARLRVSKREREVFISIENFLRD